MIALRVVLALAAAASFTACAKPIATMPASAATGIGIDTKVGKDIKPGALSSCAANPAIVC